MSEVRFLTILTTLRTVRSLKPSPDSGQAFGANMRLGIMNRVALLGEIDFEETKTDFPMKRALYWFGELDVVVIKGLELRAQYESYDRNRDVENDTRSRISAGFAAFPFNGFETDIMMRFVLVDLLLIDD
ncbi:MAG: hypothetical protein IPL67_06455 [Ignavibacteria bacterium]|nr:hypothetical protein [Ignavibacteria bacterium]